MTMNVGDKCPQCKEGLLIRTELGVGCDNCSFEQDIAEVVAAQDKARVTAGEFVFKAKTFKITIDDPEEAEEFLRGLIVARSNNSSAYFVDLIDAVNSILEPWRGHRLQQELAGRAAGGMR